MEGFWSTIIGALIGFAASFVTHAGVGRRWAKEREERQFAEALAMARVVESAEESDLAKAIARERLRMLGVTEEWVETSRADEKRRRGWEIFGPPRMPADEIDTVERAIKAEPPKPDSDVQFLVDVVSHIDAAFNRARNDARAEEDTRVRIFLVMANFIIVFGLLMVWAAIRALS